MTTRVTAIVPTLGSSPFLIRCLEALRLSGGADLEILLVAQDLSGLRATEEASRLADRTFYLVDNIGFAAANNHALAAASGEFIATVNDDAVVSENWCASLVAVLEEQPQIAAVQGINVKLDEPGIIDGCGVAWNRDWQAVQVGRGEAASTGDAPREIFGVSATAAIYRQTALAAVAGPAFGTEGLPVFDTRLFSYYEDVDLACRLRAEGYHARLVPAARAAHAGSTSGQGMRLASWPMIYSNRYLVLARLLGRSFGSQLPRIWRRDVADLWQALSRREAGRMAGIAVGWLRAALYARHYLHARAAAIPLADLRGRETS